MHLPCPFCDEVTSRFVDRITTIAWLWLWLYTPAADYTACPFNHIVWPQV
jgi:hypothetical protein